MVAKTSGTKAVRPSTESDPKAKKAASANPSAWDKVRLSEAFLAQTDVVAKAETTTFSAWIKWYEALTRERRAITSADGSVPPKQARAFFAYILGPMLAARTDPAYQGLDFRRAKPTDSPRVKKLLQNWQSFVTLADQAGVMIGILSAQGINVANDYPSMSKTKLRVLFPAWKRTCAAKSISMTKREDSAKRNAMLKALYAKALTVTRDDITAWAKAPKAVDEEGAEGAEGASPKATKADVDAMTKAVESLKGAREIKVPSAAQLCVLAKAGRYTLDEATTIRDAFQAYIKAATIAARGTESESVDDDDVEEEEEVL